MECASEFLFRWGDRSGCFSWGQRWTLQVFRFCLLTYPDGFWKLDKLYKTPFFQKIKYFVFLLSGSRKSWPLSLHGTQEHYCAIPLCLPILLRRCLKTLGTKALCSLFTFLDFGHLLAFPNCIQLSFCISHVLYESDTSMRLSSATYLRMWQGKHWIFALHVVHVSLCKMYQFMESLVKLLPCLKLEPILHTINGAFFKHSRVTSARGV